MTLQTSSDEGALCFMTFIKVETRKLNISIIEFLFNEFMVNVCGFWQPEGHFSASFTIKSTINAMFAVIGCALTSKSATNMVSDWRLKRIHLFMS